MSTSLHPQPQSPFFALPTELRLAIYAHLTPDQLHIFPHNSKCFRFSSCVQRDKDDDPDCKSQRFSYPYMNSGKDPVPDNVCGRRLRSRWGPHWRCEEVAMRMQPRDGRETDHEDTTVIAFLSVCKRMQVSSLLVSARPLTSI